jgi:hypothetical protein
MKYLKKIFEGNEEEINKAQAELDLHRKEAEARVKDFFGEFEEEFDKVETGEQLATVFKKIIKARGVIKVFKYVKNLISDTKKDDQLEKKLAELKGEKWEPDKETDAFINLFSNPASITKLVNGDISSTDVEYEKKDGGSAEGEIKSSEIKDDGSVEVTIENDKVGDVKKDLGELMPNDDSDDEGDGGDLQKKLADIKAKNPENIKKISTFVEFISKEENNDNKDKIYKIMGV